MDEESTPDGAGSPPRDGEATSFPSLRSFLFVPGSRPRLFSKAMASGADGVCVDLEDAVGPGAKDQARERTAALLEDEAPSAPPGLRSPLVMVRMNAPTVPAGARDLEALAALTRPPDAVLIPMVRDPGDVEGVADALCGPGSPVRLVPLVETARGLAAVEELAVAADAVAALLLGGHDLSLELGARPDWEPLLYARSRLVHAAALAGIDALDMPLLDLSDADGLRAEARAARALGFTGKAAIHPDQVEPIQEIFTPDEGEVEEARRVVEAYRAADGNAVLLDGRVVDRPVLEAALRTLARVGGG